MDGETFSGSFRIMLEKEGGTDGRQSLKSSAFRGRASEREEPYPLEVPTFVNSQTGHARRIASSSIIR